MVLELSNPLIDDLIGIPFKTHGRDLDGLDCFGLVKLIEKRRGINLLEFAYDTTEKTIAHKLINESKSGYTEIATPEPWCTVAFSIKKPYVHHVGMVLDNTSYFIHVMKGSFVAIERLDSEAWKTKVSGFYIWNSESLLL